MGKYSLKVPLTKTNRDVFLVYPKNVPEKLDIISLLETKPTTYVDKEEIYEWLVWYKIISYR